MIARSEKGRERERKTDSVARGKKVGLQGEEVAPRGKKVGLLLESLQDAVC